MPTNLTFSVNCTGRGFLCPLIWNSATITYQPIPSAYTGTGGFANIDGYYSNEEFHNSTYGDFIYYLVCNKDDPANPYWWIKQYCRNSPPASGGYFFLNSFAWQPSFNGSIVTCSPFLLSGYTGHAGSMVISP